MAIQKKTEGRDLDEYLQEVWDSLESAWDKSKFDMKQGYDSEYECNCITITSKDNEGVLAKIYVNDYEGRHPVGFDVVYRYPGDKGVGVMGSYEFQSTDMDGLGEEVFDYFDEIKQKVGESKKDERGSTQVETYEGFDELLGYAEADSEYLLEDVVDVLSKYYTYEDETFDEDQAKDDPEFTIKVEGGDERADYYYENIFYVHLPNKEAAEELADVLDGKLSESKKESMERCDSCGADMTEYDYDRYGGLCELCRGMKNTAENKKSEGIGDRIKMGIDYNMFMRMCRTAAYLDENEDYWDALWEYYSEIGEIDDALVFFDNLFQYTAWCDADELYDEYLSDKFKDKSKSKEECIEAAIDDGDLQAYKHESGNYLVIH